MSTPHTPDVDLLWNTSDDETALEWLRLVDSFAGGLFIDPGEHNEDPAQVVFLLYLLAHTRHEHTNFLVFEQHKDQIAQALEQWSVPLGGSDTPRYPLWRLQHHRFWRLMSWEACCEKLDLPKSTHADFAPDASVGVLDERAWLAVMSDDLLLHHLLSYLFGAYWPGSRREIEASFNLSDFVSHEWMTPARADQKIHLPTPKARPPLIFRHNRSYSPSELVDSLELLAPPSEYIVAPVVHRRWGKNAAALFIHHSARSTTHQATPNGRQEIHWQFSNRDFDNWLVLDQLAEADKILVFVDAPAGEAFEYRGTFELASAERRKWSLIRHIHDVVLRPIYP